MKYHPHASEGNKNTAIKRAHIKKRLNRKYRRACKKDLYRAYKKSLFWELW